MLKDEGSTRIGTWNLAGRWTPAHEQLLAAMDCDVLLLTEVSEQLSLPGHHVHLTEGRMAPGRRWAAVAARSELVALPDAHPATAAARWGDITVCASILPWRSASGPVWGDGRHADKTKRALAELVTALPGTHLVWGGDWNHALEGTEFAGSKGGRSHLTESLDRLGLTVPTATLPHQVEGLLSIDHIGVPTGSLITDARRWSALTPTARLSDHDAYSVDLVL